MMFFASLKMMLLPMVAMMRCLPKCAVRHTSLGEAVIIGEAIFHLPKANFVEKSTHLSADKCVLFLAGVERIELSRRESKSRVLPLDYTPIGTIDIIA